MFKKGDRVRVIDKYQRTRTLFGNAEYTPGRVYTYPGGWVGTVTEIFDMGYSDGDPDGLCIQVKKDGTHDLGYYDFAPSELVKI